MLVGQAPGPAERLTRRPFSGRAGRELTRYFDATPSAS
jgi:uracil-DNA glycosylase